MYMTRYENNCQHKNQTVNIKIKLMTPKYVANSHQRHFSKLKSVGREKYEKAENLHVY